MMEMKPMRKRQGSTRKSLGGMRRHASLLMVALIATAAAPSTALAAPSKFVFESCDSALPGGGVPEWEFQANPGVPFAPVVYCASPGGAMGVAQMGQTSATVGLMEIAIPATPGGFVEAETISGISQGMSPGNHFSHIKEDGWPGFDSGESQRTFHLRTKSELLNSGGGFAVVMSCDGNAGPCNGGILAAHYIAATEVDPTPPTLPSIGGSMFSGGVLRGHQEVAVEAADRGGGLSRVEVVVNGLPAASPVVGNCKLVSVKNPSYEGVVAATTTPCPAKLKGTWSLDTAAYPFHNGANSIQVCASDYSSLTEANRTCSTPQTATVDNSCAESSVAGGQILTAQFQRSHTEEVTVGFGKPAKVSGELTDGAGDAISGATICVLMKTQGSRKGPKPVATTTTDAHGHFVYEVPPGPNRKVKIGYRHDSFQVARAIRYYAHSRPTLRITPDTVKPGGVIVMHGRLPGPRAGGRVLVLQASALHSSRWYPFRRVTTNRYGRYHSHYPLDATTRNIVYRIRAVVPRQRGYPREEGHSRPALVKVRG
jgi:hypothetical protein